MTVQWYVPLDASIVNTGNGLSKIPVSSPINVCCALLICCMLVVLCIALITTLENSPNARLVGYVSNFEVPRILFGLGLRVDAKFEGTNSLPNIVILDFLYGVAAYNCWKSASILGTMEEYYVDHYESIPVPTPSTLSEEDSFSEQHDPVDPSHVPKRT